MWLDIDALNNFQMFSLNSKFKSIVPYIKNNIHADGGKFVPIVDIGFSEILTLKVESASEHHRNHCQDQSCPEE